MDTLGDDLSQAAEQYVNHATSFGPFPAMTYGEDGADLTASEVAVRLPPLFPW